MQVSKRGKELPVSAVRRLTPYAQAAKEQGVKLYHLNIGDPDIETPQVLLDVLKHWKKHTIAYAQSSGDTSFINALVTYYNKVSKNKIVEKNIISTVGGSEAISMTLYAITDPGDEILLFEPYYSNYSAFAAISGVHISAIPTSIDDGFHLPPAAEIEKYITPKTKALMYCSPGNPTGTVYTKDEVERLVAIAKKYNLYLISDEVYREYVFDGKKSVSLLNYFEEITDNAIIVDSLSKRYSLCGARLGAVVTYNEKVIAAVNKLAQARLSAGLIDQVMAAKINEVPKTYMQNVLIEYQNRRDFLYDSLMAIPSIYLAKPEGAFYTMVSLPVKNAEDFCIYLLNTFRSNNETVMLAPGNGFYSTKGKGENEVRIAYVLNRKDLGVSISILKQALTKYNQRKS